MLSSLFTMNVIRGEFILFLYVENSDSETKERKENKTNASNKGNKKKSAEAVVAVRIEHVRN
jgi:hypothetical protein